MNYDRYAKKIHDWNVKVGWWDDPDRCLYQTLQLVSTEVAEATEGERKDLMDDHIPHRKMGEVELADALIRVLDFGEHLGLNFIYGIEGHAWAMESCSIGKKHLAINMALMVLVEANETDTSYSTRQAILEVAYSCLIQTIADVAESLGYDLEGATNDKMLYNTTRLDHTREYRGSHFDGKKF